MNHRHRYRLSSWIGLCAVLSFVLPLIMSVPHAYADEATQEDASVQTSLSTDAPINPQHMWTQGAQEDGDRAGNGFGFYSARPSVPTWQQTNDGLQLVQSNGAVFANNAVKVVDVSEHQGSVNWAAVKNAGISGAIVRAGYGVGCVAGYRSALDNSYCSYDLQVDTQFQRNITEVKRAGIPYGTYLYSYADTATMGSQEARFLADVLDRSGVDKARPVYYDLEQFAPWGNGAHRPPTSPQRYAEIVNAFCSTMQQRGYSWIRIYTYTSYIQGNNAPLAHASITSRTGWIAQYNSVLDYTFAGYGAERGWQYSSVASVAGISGNVDISGFDRAFMPASCTAGWVTKGTKQYWYDSNCVMATSREIKDASGWHWVDSDGSMAKNKDVWIPYNGGKWVRYDANGRMVYGESYHDGGWYYYKPGTGQRARGVTLIPVQGGGSKWVYYDVSTGKMAHGEAHLNYDAEHTGWYYFDPVTGAMRYGFVYLANNKKWVYYDTRSGKMQYGERCIGGKWYYFRPGTGARATGFVDLPGKRVYYDPATGQMVYGKVNINGRTYQFDPVTGAMK